MNRERLSVWRRIWLVTACARNELPRRRPSRGELGVWIAGIPSPKRWRRLEQRGVQTVIGLTIEMRPPEWMATALDVHWIPVPDHHAPTIIQLREACALLDAAVSAGREALVYCGAGKGRAPTVYAAWLIWRGAELADALARTRRVRRVGKPNGEQIAALAEWSALRKRSNRC